MIINNISGINFDGKKYRKNRKKPPTESIFAQTKPKVKPAKQKPKKTIQTEVFESTQSLNDAQIPYFAPVIPVAYSIDSNLKGIEKLKDRINYIAFLVKDDAAIISKETKEAQDMSINLYTHAQNVVNHVMFETNGDFENSTSILQLGSKIYRYAPLEINDKNGTVTSFEIEEYKNNSDTPKRIITAKSTDEEDNQKFKPVTIEEFDSNGNSTTYFYNKPLYSVLAIKNYEQKGNKWSGEKLIANYGKVTELYDEPEGITGDIITLGIEKYSRKYFLHNNELREFSTNYDVTTKASSMNELKMRFFDNKLKFAQVNALGIRNKKFAANENGMIELE